MHRILTLAVFLVANVAFASPNPAPTEGQYSDLGRRFDVIPILNLRPMRLAQAEPVEVLPVTPSDSVIMPVEPVPIVPAPGDPDNEAQPPNPRQLVQRSVNLGLGIGAVLGIGGGALVGAITHSATSVLLGWSSAGAMAAGIGAGILTAGAFFLLGFCFGSQLGILRGLETLFPD